MTIEPNSPVVVAREVRMHLDIRSPDEQQLAAAADELATLIPQIATRARVDIEQTETHSWGVASFDGAGVDMARAAADSLELTRRPVMTVAGHDSVNMKDVTPTVMLFVPSVDGISHNEGEFTRDADICAGTDLLTDVVYRAMTGELDR